MEELNLSEIEKKINAVFESGERTIPHCGGHEVAGQHVPEKMKTYRSFSPEKIV